MMGIGMLEWILLPVLVVGPSAIALVAIYWVVRLAVRHEKQRSA